ANQGARRGASTAAQTSRYRGTMATDVQSWRSMTTSNLAHQSLDAGAQPKTDQAGPSHRSIDRRRNFEEREFKDHSARVDVIARHQLRDCRHWRSAFALQHKDYRYYEIVEDT